MRLLGPVGLTHVLYRRSQLKPRMTGVCDVKEENQAAAPTEPVSKASSKQSTENAAPENGEGEKFLSLDALDGAWSGLKSRRPLPLFAWIITCHWPQAVYLHNSKDI